MEEEKMLSKIIILMLGVLLYCGGLAQADIITIGLTAQVDNVGDSYNLLENKIHVGDTITGFYTYDSSTPNSDPQPQYNGVYPYTTAPYGMSLTVGSVTFQTNSANVNFVVSLTNNFYSDPYDSYGITSHNNLALNNGLSVDRLQWGLADYDGTTFSSTELPQEPLDLSKWQSNYLSVMGGRYPFPSPSEKTLFQVNGHVTDVYLVPEPASLCLLAFGGLILRRKCKK
jgi:hypothetical protein